MRTLMAVLMLVTASVPVLAQRMPPTMVVRAVGDRSNVFLHRGGEVEMFPDQRASVVGSAAGGKKIGTMRKSAASSGFTDSSRGVVFNVATQQYGVVNGEIAFMLKDASGLTTLQLDPALKPKKIMASGVYVVNAKTPASYMHAIRYLQARPEVLWVEPTVLYGQVQSNSVPLK